MPSYKFLIALLVSLIFTACGGGGGGGGGNDGGSGSGSGSGGNTSLSVDKQSITFKVDQNQPSEPQLVNATFKGDGLILGYAPNVVQPNWLDASVLSSTATTAVVRVAINSQAPVGTLSTSIRLVTGKVDGTQLKTIDLPITVTVNPVISITSAPYSGNFIYGSSTNSENYPVNITGSTSAWTATSDQPWLQVITGSGTGNKAIETKVNSATLSAGTYTGHLTVTASNNPNKPAVLAYSVNITNPTLSGIPSSILLGGEDGLSTGAHDVSFSINTGSASHPYTISLITDDGKPWLKTSKANGTTSATEQTIKLSADTAGITSGTFTGKATIQAKVGTLTLSKEVAVKLNKEANRIVVSATGVAFSSLPNRSSLTRDLKVLSSIDRTDVPWTAKSDQTWLTVTASGVTGGSLKLTANPSNLATDHVYFATVTVKSSDADVENQETIRVGLTLSSTAATDVSITTKSTDSRFSIDRPFVVTSPVEPLAFSNVDSTTIKAFNVYTGAEERNFSDLVAKVGGMTISSDGLRLYIYDQINIEVVEIDATSGALLHKYSTASEFSGNTGASLAYMRPDGRPILVGAGFHMYDLATHADITPQNGSWIGGQPATTEPRLIADVAGQVYKLTRTALNGGSLHNELIFSDWINQGETGQACINPQNTRVYTATPALYDFPGVNIVSRQVEQLLPGKAYAVSILCGWNGLIIGGSTLSGIDDIFIYNGFDGQNLGIKSSLGSLLARGLALSGDATRLVSIGENHSTPNQIRFQTVPSIP